MSVLCKCRPGTCRPSEKSRLFIGFLAVYSRSGDYSRNKNTLDNYFVSDEFWFTLDGYVNSQNCRILFSENPHA